MGISLICFISYNGDYNALLVGMVHVVIFAHPPGIVLMQTMQMRTSAQSLWCEDLCHYKQIITTDLKPQESFGEFDKFFLDLQKVQEIIRKHHQTFLQLFGMTYCNAILPNGKLSLCAYCITYGKVFGGNSKTFFMFWLFPENGSISERTVCPCLHILYVHSWSNC